MLTLILLLTLQAWDTKASTNNNTCLHLDFYSIHTHNDLHECSKGHICNRVFKVSYVDVPPYVTIFSIKNDILEKCCGKCVQVMRENYLRHLHEERDAVNAYSKDSSDLIFPVLQKSTTTICHGYYFIPVVRLPSLMFVSRIQTSPFERAVVSCVNLYPMLLICLLMSLIAGFIIWIMERNGSPEEFPREFPLGWVKGIWWSTVTLAATGLEHTPKSVPARIMSIIWVVAGVIMLGLLTSSITAAMLKPIPIPSMDGARVGTLKYRPYNEYVITKNGGRVKTFPQANISVEFFMMARSFYLGEIDGILIDRYTLNFATKYIRRNHFQQNEILKFFTTHTLLTEKRNAEEMSFGMLVKDVEVYNYFREAVKENWLYYETLFAKYVNNITVDEKQRREFVKDSTAPLFSPSDPYVYYAMSGFGGTLVLLCTFGFFYEYHRRRTTKETLANGSFKIEEYSVDF